MLSRIVHPRQASRSTVEYKTHTSNHTTRAVRMSDTERKKKLRDSEGSGPLHAASQLWRKHQASPPVEFHTPRLGPKRTCAADATSTAFLALPPCYMRGPLIQHDLFFACFALSCRATIHRFADLLFVMLRCLSGTRPCVLISLSRSSVCCLYTCCIASRLDSICLLGLIPACQDPVSPLS